MDFFTTSHDVLFREPDEIAFNISEKGLITPTIDSLHRLLESYGLEPQLTIYSRQQKKYSALYIDSQNNEVLVTYSWVFCELDFDGTRANMWAISVQPKILTRLAATGEFEEDDLIPYVNTHPKNRFDEIAERMINDMVQRQETVLKRIYT